MPQRTELSKQLFTGHYDLSARAKHDMMWLSPVTGMAKRAVLANTLLLPNFSNYFDMDPKSEKAKLEMRELLSENYDDAESATELELHVLRNKKNKTLATIITYGSKVIKSVGNGNITVNNHRNPRNRIDTRYEAPSVDIRPHISEFMLKKDFIPCIISKDRNTGNYNAHATGLVRDDEGTIHDIANLTAGATFQGTLDIRELQGSVTFPNDFTITDALYASRINSGVILGNHFTIKEEASFIGTPMKYGNKPRFEDDVYLMNTGPLPHDLHVGNCLHTNIDNGFIPPYIECRIIRTDLAKQSANYSNMKAFYTVNEANEAMGFHDVAAKQELKQIKVAAKARAQLKEIGINLGLAINTGPTG